jgi:hypothetical protein
MAVVGEARITVVADTRGVKDQIRRGFQGATAEAQRAAEDVSKAFNKGISDGSNGSGFTKWAKEAKKLSSEFHKAIRNSYKWQAATGALLQSIMALGGGLLALVGNIAGAASAGVALVGVMVQLKVASLVGKQAFSGVMAAVKAGGTAAGGTGKTIRELREEMQQLAFSAEEAALSQEKASISLEKARENLARVQNLPPDNRARREAELAYQEADLAYRKAKDRNADLQEQINNPQKKSRSGAGADPYKNLTETQKKFAQYLVSVQPKMKELREAAASSFLPELTRQMQVMFKGGFFQMLVKGFENVSSGLAKATRGFTNTLFDPNTKKNMAELFKNSATTVGTLGGALGKVFGGFLTLMRAIQPLIGRFVLFLNSRADNFGRSMQGNFANIMEFFREAGDAAAGWGQLLEKLFTKFKEMIKANVGPGTGGQLLLDFFNKGTAGFRGLDGAAGEFARKQHFLAAATNLKAMLESLGKIFSFMSDLGTDPAIAGFWGILAELEEPLGHIFSSITGAGDELAKLLVTVVEIVASFTDSGQLTMYLEVLGTTLKVIGSVVGTLSPIIQAFGPLVGTIGALVTTMLLLSKTTKIVAGTWMAFSGVVSGTTRVLTIYRTALKLNTAAETFGARVKAGLLLLTTKQGRADAIAAIKTAFSASKKTVETAATAALVGAKTADGVATTGVGIASSVATPQVAAFSVAVNSAIWPLTLIALAIAAVVAAVVLLVSWMNQIKADNIKKANKAISKEFDETRGKVIGATDAQRQWTAALLSVGDSQKSGITDLKSMGKALNDTGKVYYSRAGAVRYYSQETMNAREAMDAYIGSLAKLAKKNLPEAQRQFRNMVVASGMNRKATELAVTSNKDMVAALEKQAKAMGDTIMNADGTVNALKAVDYAIGEGSYVRRKAVLEQQKFAETFKNAAKSFIDSNDAMQKATDDKGKFSLSKYIKNLREQGTALINWRLNISKLNKLFTDKKALEGIIAQGAAGADLVASLAAGGQAAVDSYTAAQGAAAAATKDAETFAAAFGDTTAVVNLIRKKFKGDSWQMRGLTEELAQGYGALELQAKYGIKESDIIAEQKRLQGGADLASTVNLNAQWDEQSLKDAKEQLKKGLGDVTLEVKKTSKDGGFFDSGLVNGFRSGGLVGRFADGFGPSYTGRVSGLGTARSDQIPAMISNGEFVVNARATAQNLALLTAINSNRNVSAVGGGISVVVNAAPGMDETQVANIVVRQLDRAIGLGGAK